MPEPKRPTLETGQASSRKGLPQAVTDAGKSDAAPEVQAWVMN